MKAQKEQGGRSLTEMLGVLVIIGVLTIGALVGYRYSIDKNHTNETLREITSRRIVLDGQYNRYQEMNQDEFGKTTMNGYPVDFDVLPNDLNGFYIEIDSVPMGVCKQILKSNYPALISVNGSSITCKASNLIRFTFETDGWCVQLDDKGNCCDEKGRCCPKDKPLLDTYGRCTACNVGTVHIIAGEGDEMCNRCPGMTMVVGGTRCAKKCPAGQWRDSNGACHTCDDVVATYVEDRPEMISLVLACPKLTLTTNYVRPYVQHCDMADQALPVKGYPETCSKCTNRALTGNKLYCARTCAPGFYMLDSGACRSCDTVSRGRIDNTPQNIAAVLACPKVILENGETTAPFAAHCDVADQAVVMKGYTETCTKCGNRTLGLNNGFCAKNCPDGAQFYDSTGKCHSCDEAWSGWFDYTPSNLAKFLACPKTLMATGNWVSHCDSASTSIDVTGYTDRCANCPNRTLQGNRCVLK